MLNKLIKAVSYFVVHLVVAVELYLLALLITSPIFSLVIGVMDLLNKVPQLKQMLKLRPQSMKVYKLQHIDHLLCQYS